ncbi:MAG TPA: MarR family transcriptional regulator [Cytophagales bacterium]|jgi:DNA-binding MarR family transcriptional regulator|nr:MarR family transcriptional regulator [Cytophagales bacterium]
MKLEEEIRQKTFKDPFIKAVININFTSVWLNARQNQVIKPYGISIQQFNILRILKGQYPNTAPLKLLTERMIDKMSNTSRLVEKLRTKNLVERHICPDNRRQVDIIITEKGLELVNEVSDVLDRLFAEINKLSDDEAEELNRLLDKIRS